MKVARAFTITAAAILSCNVAESEAQWLVGTSYAANAVVRQTVDGVHRRFHSIAGSNVGHD
ncbi:MAG TPA: hypothetical protein VFH92_14530, partial [Phenylobacterium sp.]|nr:hypothetical protein [Phenylobacterium sp.]